MTKVYVKVALDNENPITYTCNSMGVNQLVEFAVKQEYKKNNLEVRPRKMYSNYISGIGKVLKEGIEVGYCEVYTQHIT